MIPLHDLKVEVVMREWQGQKLKVLQFKCPACDTDNCLTEDHRIEIPFSDTGNSIYDREGKLLALVWMQLGHKTLEHITLSPSFKNTGACNIHGHIRNGFWVPC